MSDSDVIVTSSDEDLDSFQVSEDKRYFYDTDGVESSTEQVHNYRSLVPCNLNFLSQSDHSYSMAATNNSLSESSDSEENEDDSSPFSVKCFKKFIRVVLPAEPNEIDKERIIKTLFRYCKLAEPGYIRSPAFTHILENGMAKINENSVYLYFVLKGVKDALLAKRAGFGGLKNTEKETLSSGENASQEPTPGTSSQIDPKDMDEDTKKAKMEKLTSVLAKLHKKIKKLEESEVDLSDEEDSNYLKMQRYREKYSHYYEELCKYTNRPFDAERVGGVKMLNFSGTENLQLNRAIEKWLNKTRQFPDFCDVNNYMIELNQSLNLKLNREQLSIKAQQIFEKIGIGLQRRRHFDLWDSLSSFLGTEFDPAVRNPELQALLQKNHDLGANKEEELLDFYAERQEEERLLPYEVPDDVANCSPLETDDEDEEEIEFIEKMLVSKISISDYEDEDSKDNVDEDDDDESDEAPPRYSLRNPASRRRNKGRSRMVAKRKTRARKNDPQRSSVSNDNREQIDDVGSKGIDSHTCVNSEKTETAGTSAGTSTGTIPIKKKNTVGATPNKQDTEENLVVCKSENSMKRKNENLEENDNDDVHPCKKFSEEREMTETRNYEENEITNKNDSDSDCEIIKIVINKEGESSKALLLNSKKYEVNYAFKNNNFNHNAALSDNVNKKRHCFPSNQKNTKNQKPLHDFPPNELPNNKSIANKNASHGENKVKKKSKNTLNKPKSLNSVTWETSNDSDLKNNDLAISTDTNNINCSLQQGKSGENMKNKKEVNKKNQNSDLEQGSNNETAAPPNAGSSSGGSGQDNNDNNGKKPPSNETQTEDNLENEDKEEDEEEDADTPEKKPSETDKVSEAVPKRMSTRRNGKEQKLAGGAVVKPPPTEKVAPVRRSSSGRQAKKPSGSEGTQRKPLNSTSTDRTSRARSASSRKRKINQSGGTQGTPQPVKRNVFTFQFQKGPAELKKRNIKKPVPATATSSASTTATATSSAATSSASTTATATSSAATSSASTTATSSASTTATATSSASTTATATSSASTTATASASSSKDDDVEIIQITKKKRSTPVKTEESDEDIVKNFLERSHPGISIKTPKTRLIQKEPPPSVRQALETLSRLKGISTTIVKGSSKHNSDDEITIISESLNPRVYEISKQQKPAPSATATMPPPVATATTSHEPFLPKIVTVQGNVQGFEDIADESMIIEDNAHQNYIQNPQASLVTASGVKTDYGENFYNPQAHSVVSATATNFNEHFYNPQPHLANVSGTGRSYNDHYYSRQTPVATVSGSASTLQENLYGPQAPTASTSGNAGTYEDNFTGTVECIPIPRFRTSRSRSRPTPKKTKNIEYIILD